MLFYLKTDYFQFQFLKQALFALRQEGKLKKEIDFRLNYDRSSVNLKQLKAVILQFNLLKTDFDSPCKDFCLPSTFKKIYYDNFNISVCF